MKWVKRFLIVVVVLVLGIVVFGVLKNEKRPEIGQQGPDADALAKKVQAATGNEHWNEIGAISVNYAGRHVILWDRTRNLARVDFNGKRALFRIADKSGVAYEDGKEVTDPAAKEKIITEGNRWFINDTFWLNPFASLFDQNVTRSIAADKDGNKGLLITYGSGGVTPGDAYLWFADENGIPKKWKMWVSLIPVGGLEATWDNWKELPGGAKVSTKHETIKNFEITDVKAGKTLAEVEPGEDPFKALTVSTATASSQPAT